MYNENKLGNLQISKLFKQTPSSNPKNRNGKTVNYENIYKTSYEVFPRGIFFKQHNKTYLFNYCSVLPYDSIHSLYNFKKN